MIVKQMLKIMWHDRKTTPTRILRKSYARYRRFGYKNMRRKLEREYYALYPGENRRQLESKLYRQWRRKYEPKLRELSVPREGPLFNLLLDLSSGDIRYLKATLRSLLRQSYGRWEIWIVGYARMEQKGRRTFEQFIGKDPRVHFVEGSLGELDAQQRLQILDDMNGEYLLRIDPSDRLPEYALTLYAKRLAKRPGLALVYGDEDCIDGRGVRSAPWFKTEWNPDLFHSHNCIGRSWCLNMNLLRKIGIPRESDRVLSDYEILLQAIKMLTNEQKSIEHIPKILYHTYSDAPLFQQEYRRRIPELVAKNLKETEGISVRPGLLPGSCKVEYSLPEQRPKVSIIVPTRDGYGLLQRCIQSVLEKTRYSNYEILIVDNQSSCPRTLEYMQNLERQYQHISVLRYDHPFNYSAINNFAARQANGDVLILLNNDVEVISDRWMTEMVQHALRPEIGAVGAKLYYDNLTIQHAGVILGFGGVAGHGHKFFPRESEGYHGRLSMIQNYSAVTAACLAVRKALYFEVEGLEEEHLTVAFNDVDFCLKLLEKGYRNLWTPYAELYHHESRTRGIDDTPEKKARFDAEVAYMKKRWGKLLKNDPCYSPHLSLFFEDFRIETYWKQRRELWA